MTDLLDKGYNVDVFYLDFSKAFDRVPHQRLLVKLKAYGSAVHDWINAWLSGRKQRVVLNGAQSDWEDVPSGRPPSTSGYVKIRRVFQSSSKFFKIRRVCQSSSISQN